MSHSMSPSEGKASGEKAPLTVRSVSGEAQTPEQIEAEIEVQRAQLAETIDALSAKLDVKSQAQAKVEEAKQTAQTKVAQVKETVTHTVSSTAHGAQAAGGGIRRPEVIAFGVTVLVATVVLWWRER